ncbi:MAG: hypothetical protein QXD98_02915 [Candidatus Diapherotrites archaeon]
MVILKPDKVIVVDSSSIITISDNCLIKIIKHLSEMNGITFVIPESVYEESVIHPLSIKQYEFNAIRIKDAVEEGYLKIIKTSQNVKNMMEIINDVSYGICYANGKPIRLIQRGETEALALAKDLKAKILLVDERTTRMLIEDPYSMRTFLENRHKKKITIQTETAKKFMNMFNDINIVRSVELIALAYETGAFEKEVHKSKQSLEASLWAAKFSGCAVSEEEIYEYLASLK